jgi:hypothetical protein
MIVSDKIIANVKNLFRMPLLLQRMPGICSDCPCYYAGYERMRFDTGDKQIEARSLYRSLGFQEIKPYYILPEEVKKRLLFMELIL